MKPKITLMLLLACVSIARAGQDSAKDLVARFAEAVNIAARGDIGRAVQQLNTQARSPKSPKELGAQIEAFRNVYGKVAQLGELDQVEQVSLVFTGESFFRLRLAEKRAEGVILWTFVGYRFKDQWYCKGIHFNGSDDLLQLMHDELDAADATTSQNDKKG